MAKWWYSAPENALLVRKRSQVRYANPFDAPVEYLSVCRPAFSPRTVNHEESSEE